jgi:hypothetical protein
MAGSCWFAAFVTVVTYNSTVEQEMDAYVAEGAKSVD